LSDKIPRWVGFSEDEGDWSRASAVKGFLKDLSPILTGGFAHMVCSDA